jgi:5-formyltetrahydrofolate cyclo-ligase
MEASDPMTVEKGVLRAELRTRRRALAPVERLAENAAITAMVIGDTDVLNAMCVHVYLSTAYEVSTTAIIRALIDRGVTVVVPWMQTDGSMGATHLLEEDLPSVAAVGPRGVPSAPVLREVDLSTVDVVLVPLVGVDRRGHRLGMGAGHYDRFLAAFPKAITIGLAFTCQVVDELPDEPHDMPLTRVVTSNLQ